MDSRILGGKSNTPVVIDVDGHMHVNASQASGIDTASWKGNAFSMLAEVDLSSTAIEPMLWIRNDRTGKDAGRKQMLVVDRMIISSDANVHAEVWVGADYTSGGGAAQLANLNRGEVDSFDVTAKDGTTALVLDLSSARELQSLFIGAYDPYPEDFRGRLKLPASKTFAIQVQGATGNKVRIELNAYWAPEPE